MVGAERICRYDTCISCAELVMNPYLGLVQVVGHLESSYHHTIWNVSRPGR